MVTLDLSWRHTTAFIIESLETLPRTGERLRFLFFFLMSSHVLGTRPERMTQFQPFDIIPLLTKRHLQSRSASTVW